MFIYDLVYEISIFLSPKDLIKLSLCSKHLRKLILGDQSIWRTQYYIEWPAFFTPRNSAEYAYFPAPTWLQTFLMRKLSLLNIERQKMREIPCEIDYQFLQDLYIHRDNELNKLVVYKDLHQKVVEYDSLPTNFHYRLLNKYRCGEDLFVCHDMILSELYCFSLNGKYTCTKVDQFFDMVFIDKSRFFGIVDGNLVCSYKINPNMEVQQQDISSLRGRRFAPIQQKPGFCVLAETSRNTSGRIKWCIYDLRQTQPKLVMEKEIRTQSAVTRISKFILADLDFVFIPFALQKRLYVYIYSFKEDGYRIISVADLHIYNSDPDYVAVLYDSTWSNETLYSLSYGVDLFWIYLSGTSLDSFAATVFDFCCYVTKLIQISRKVLLIMAKDGFSIVSAWSGSDIWAKKYSYQDTSCNDRYLVCDRTLYDFSPETPPEIQEWLYKLFK